MNQQDKQSVANICNAFQLLPDSKREYLMGVADGMAAMAAGGQERQPGQSGTEREQPNA